MLQIQEYDLTTEFDIETKDEKKIKYEASQEMTYPDFGGLLNQISDLLKEHDTIASVWPEAKDYTSSDLFSHLHIEFNSREKSIKLKTAGTDIKGEPVFEYDYDLKGELTATPVPPPAPKLQSGHPAPTAPTHQAPRKQSAMEKFENFFFNK